MAMVRFYRGELLLGMTEVDPELPLIELANQLAWTYQEIAHRVTAEPVCVD